MVTKTWSTTSPGWKRTMDMIWQSAVLGVTAVAKCTTCKRSFGTPTANVGAIAIVCAVHSGSSTATAMA